jgi:hypothetical protein
MATHPPTASPDGIVSKGNNTAGAIFSPDEVHRYTLWRRLSDNLKNNPDAPPILFVLLNPSTATHEVSDPTVTRCINYAKTWGHGRITVVNIFAVRETDPRNMKASKDPIGPHNDHYIHAEAENVAKADAGRIICAWGAHGEFLDRGQRVATLLQDIDAPLHCLALTKAGHPKHPLYLRADLKPMRFTPG